MSASMPASASASACARVRGKPSSSHPCVWQSACCRRSFTMPMMTSSGTSWPLSMYPCASFPISVPSCTAARSMSPVDRCTTPMASTSSLHWVPFPDAGAPAMIMRGGRGALALIRAKDRRTTHSLRWYLALAFSARVVAARTMGEVVAPHAGMMAVLGKASVLVVGGTSMADAWPASSARRSRCFANIALRGRGVARGAR
mmetsp:Transcript_10082/g.38180  ORF Transcript_10082/g.38180 Transcript_10082/m.38180 type:complete len:201 (+) Transcript_10082:1264-1866(+)